jgi:hypothetical protein
MLGRFSISYVTKAGDCWWHAFDCGGLTQCHAPDRSYTKIAANFDARTGSGRA